MRPHFLRAASAGKIITDGLVLHLDADNAASYPGSGTTWFDISGNDLDTDSISNNGFPSYNSNGFFEFDGAMETMALPQDDLLNGEDEYKKTVSVWFHTDLTFDNTQARGIVCGGGRQAHYIMYLQDDDLYVGFKKGGVRTGITTSLSTNTWYNATYVLDLPLEINSTQDDTFEVFLNGVSQGTADARKQEFSQRFTIGGGLRSTGLTSNNHMYGRSVHGDSLYAADDFSYSNFKGYIAVVLMYNRALTDAEVLRNYKALLPRYD